MSAVIAPSSTRRARGHAERVEQGGEAHRNVGDCAVHAVSVAAQSPRNARLPAICRKSTLSLALPLASGRFGGRLLSDSLRIHVSMPIELRATRHDPAIEDDVERLRASEAPDMPPSAFLRRLVRRGLRASQRMPAPCPTSRHGDVAPGGCGSVTDQPTTPAAATAGDSPPCDADDPHEQGTAA